MAKFRRTRKRQPKLHRSPLGGSPGQIISDPLAAKPVIHVLAFSAVEIVDKQLTDLNDIESMLHRFPVTWVNIDGLGDADVVQEIGRIFGFHRLALEDVVNVNQRAKLEHYQDHHYLVTRILTLQEQLDSEQLSIFVGRNFVVTFQEHPGECLNPVRTRIRANTGKIRTAGPDYLVYSILDAVIDSYFPLLETYGERMDSIEDEILDGHRADEISRIHNVKRDLLSLRRAVWPLRDITNTLVRDVQPPFTEETRIYLRDCYDHVVRIMDLVETYRELASDLMDLYLSMVSFKLNEVMKVLTIISTIFIPLTFIVGVYGMNFDTNSSPWNMPELNLYYGYPIVMGGMFILALFLLAFFRKKQWI